jgi:hypothetical protein
MSERAFILIPSDYLTGENLQRAAGIAREIGLVLVSGLATARRSLDGSLTLLKIPAEHSEAVSRALPMFPGTSLLSYQETLTLIATPDWLEPEP